MTAGEQTGLVDRVRDDVKALIGRHDVTTAQLIAWTGIKSPTTIASRRRGESEWTLTELNGIARGLGVDVAVIFGPRT